MSTTRTVRAFYTVVLATALGGSVTAAAAWLDVPWWVAAGPIAAAELGGVVLMRHANERRKLGERALAAMSLSFAFAALAVATNVLGHDHVGMAAFFGGFSGLGYLVYLLITAAERRDALRATGKLEDTTPAYGAWQWLRHPGITRRARLLAQANAAARLAEGTDPSTPRLGRGASLAAAREQIRAEKRHTAIATALDKLIRDKAGEVMADIAVNTYDVEHIARRIAERADLDGYAALISGGLTPAKLAGGMDERDDLTAVVDAIGMPPAGPIATVAAPATYRPRWRPPTARRPRRMSRPAPAINVTVVAADKPRKAATEPATDPRPVAARKAAKQAATTEQKVAALIAKNPTMTQADVAARLQTSTRTVRRYWPKQVAAVNGHDHSKED